MLPHHGDTGGFFVAVLQKTRELPVPPQAPCACSSWLFGVLFTRHVCTNSRQCRAAGMSGRTRVETRSTLCQAVVLLRRRAAPAVEQGEEPAFSVPAAKPPSADVLAAAAGLAPAVNAGVAGGGAGAQGLDPVSEAADEAGDRDTADRDRSDPVGDAAYKEVEELADEAADAADTFAQAIHQKARPACVWLLFVCTSCQPVEVKNVLCALNW